jgi:hypothetical protein
MAMTHTSNGDLSRRCQCKKTQDQIEENPHFGAEKTWKQNYIFVHLKYNKTNRCFDMFFISIMGYFNDKNLVNVSKFWEVEKQILFVKLWLVKYLDSHEFVNCSNYKQLWLLQENK